MSPPLRLRLAAALSLSIAASGQTLDQIRESLRQAASNARQSAFMAGFVDLAENDLLAAGTLRIHSDAGVDVATYRLPYHAGIALGNRLPECRIEAGLSYFTADATFPDLWTGQLPGLETKVDCRWQGVGGHVAAGPDFDLGSSLRLAPMGDGSLAYLENHADYTGPGAGTTAAITDGILFDWHATSVAYGLALRLEHTLDLGKERRLTSVLRHDLRRFDVVRSTDPAQDSADTQNRLLPAPSTKVRPAGRAGGARSDGIRTSPTPRSWAAAATSSASPTTSRSVPVSGLRSGSTLCRSSACCCPAQS